MLRQVPARRQGRRSGSSGSSAPTQAWHR
jgi:hypothetical protein